MKYRNRVTGGKFPKTSTILYAFLLLGLVLTVIGVVGWSSRRHYE